MIVGTLSSGVFVVLSRLAIGKLHKIRLAFARPVKFKAQTMRGVAVPIFPTDFLRDFYRSTNAQAR